MHFVILSEDRSGETMLKLLLEKITPHDTFETHPYKGIGHIPKNLNSQSDLAKRQLLNTLPKVLRGCAQRFQYIEATIIVVCDLDNRCLSEFRQELLTLLDRCNPRPHARFCIAVEEGEAWLLGDTCAVKKAYPKAKQKALDSYRQDSICGTWERLADAVHPGGSKELAKRHWTEIGAMKDEWAKTITPHIDVDTNASPSFQYFRDTLRSLSSPVAP